MKQKKIMKIPAHLSPYISQQHYESYTPIDHAVWRFVMKQNHFFLKKIAHPAYVNGLASSGINTESIPKVDEMNESLASVGWRAVSIDGLIPGAAFYSFLANGILPIATKIRKLQNIAYTPAPDILHEAAGHAPILLDQTYREYVKKIGTMGSKALSSKEKLDVFRAVRHLTIVAEDPTSTPEQVKAAEEKVADARKKVKSLAEADLISRLFWWTVEYGLIDDWKNPRIYGAGLLSSVGESQSCLADNVRKIPFSIEECIKTSYDVTKPQPQLFVCRNFEELVEEIDKFAGTMAFQKGGTESLEKALQSDYTATIVYSSGLQVTGTLSTIIKDKKGEAAYIRTKGATALSLNNQEVPGHGKETHHKGFGAPIGVLEGNVAMENCTSEQLKDYGLVKGERSLLNFQSGVKVEGTVKEILFSDGSPILISFEDCMVTYQEQVLFDKGWGIFDMPVGERITSVFAGAAGPNAYFDLQTEGEVDGLVEIRSLTELERLYAEVRNIRKLDVWNQESLAKINEILMILDYQYPSDWLLRLEILELLKKYNIAETSIKHVLETLKNTDWEKSISQMIERGLMLINES
ncbi:aromatic amino acid hydroxylase [Neobacillus niacini]|uniref:aromatic amino acid hydroxylase n=1 Tax=Neobacillus niacini TaxID=86668 RepID=UPI002857241F|nr:aromatic amino acid hydroxylase [Neobacillus niacini]MDR7002580.1 phenylalanine-4-hydroxylase [Neobacillus niacini]